MDKFGPTVFHPSTVFHPLLLSPGGFGGFFWCRRRWPDGVLAIPNLGEFRLAVGKGGISAIVLAILTD
jgi:hypothetical protein